MLWHPVTLAPAHGVQVAMSLAGASTSEFVNLQTRFVSALAGVAGVPAAYVSITSAASAGSTRRRLQGTSDIVAVQASIATASPTATTATLATATTNGSLAAAVQPLGLTVVANSVQVDGQSVTSSTGSSSGGSPSPSPAAPATSSSSSGGSSAPIGAIVGGVVGGVGGLAVAAVVVVLVVRRRRAAAAEAATYGVTATVRTGSGPRKIQTQAQKLAADEASGASTSPRSPRLRNNRTGLSVVELA